ncbi:uncharacterized protein PAC_08411 [Phialocephala subalpina]|uniref:Uncharacterized protein n=1 Tax=Phialocephala subalpina TaxID=576137 RepID=A0A1L7X0G8_9HELO|nr:uncharacterized protein PAC_08411 [Phialocephala subalpina]
MASMRAPKPGEDAFDSLEWDPDLPAAKSPDDSPEPVPIKPQPLAYTTVGSVINPTSTPQLAPPNRIQREGANRRPLMSLLQGLQQSSAQRRGPPPPLSMSNSMHYAQQLSSRPSNPDNANPFPRSTRAPTIGMMQEQEQEQDTTIMNRNNVAMLTQQEKDIMMMQFGTYPSLQSRTPSPLKRSNLLAYSKHQSFNLKELLDEDARNQFNNALAPVQGLEKMQTLQRLAKFDNPMQQLARNRLSEFSVSRSQTSSVNPLGELNRDYQFPPPGIAGQSAPQSNPLLAAIERSFTTRSPPRSRPPGYPQPLTAGPPGQRQFPCTTSSQNGIVQQGRWEAQDWYNSLGTHQTNNPWAYQHTAQILQAADDDIVIKPARLDFKDIYVHVKVADTLPPAEMAKYYPHGWPNNFTGHFAPLPVAIQRKMDDASTPPTLEEKQARKNALFDHFFYYNQRRMWGLSLEDYEEECEAAMDYGNSLRNNDFGPIAPPPPARKKFTESVIPQKVTVEGMNKMDLAEASAPIFNAAFGTLLSLHDKNSNSPSLLSRFGEVDPDLIDAEAKGNASLFGEDWGRVLTKTQSRASRGSSRRS